MGSGNSSLTSSRSKRNIMSSLLCGASSSRPSPEVEDVSNELLVSSTVRSSLVNNEAQGPAHPRTNAGIRLPSTHVETMSHTQCAASECGHTGVVVKNDPGKCVYENEELIPSHQVSRNSSHSIFDRDTGTSADSTSYKECQPSAPNVNASANKNAVIGVDSSVDKDVSQNYPEVVHPSTSSLLGSQNSRSDGTPIINNDTELTPAQYTTPDFAPEISGLEVTLQLPGNRSSRGSRSHLGLIVSDRDSGLGDGSVLHVDMVSISSSILSGGNTDSSNNEFRRSSRRVFWDAFSRRNSRRFMDSPTLMNAVDDVDELGSQDRWLLDFDHNLSHDETTGDSGYLGSQMHSLSERRRHARSEIWGRLNGSLSGSAEQTPCPTGLHLDGSCSCDSYMMTGESSASSSISRIVMLAEALFEVLDEIHRQPGSLSLSMVSRPAPASVVDSLPLKSHKKFKTEESGDDDVAQCYICLADYEDEDKIRVLPCNHEFHMSCVDKWLKEIHGICPLCRGEVREDVSKSSSSPEIELI